jgi:hypothetical protein
MDTIGQSDSELVFVHLLSVVCKIPMMRHSGMLCRIIGILYENKKTFVSFKNGYF